MGSSTSAAAGGSGSPFLPPRLDPSAELVSAACFAFAALFQGLVIFGSFVLGTPNWIVIGVSTLSVLLLAIAGFLMRAAHGATLEQLVQYIAAQRAGGG